MLVESIGVGDLVGSYRKKTSARHQNCQEICRKTYSRLSMITKLKYVGVSFEDLLDIYVLFIRSVMEYFAVAFHSRLGLRVLGP